MNVLALNSRTYELPIEAARYAKEGIPDLRKFQHELGICTSQQLGRKTAYVSYGNHTRSCSAWNSINEDWTLVRSVDFFGQNARPMNKTFLHTDWTGRLQKPMKINPLTPNNDYSGRTAPLISKCCILYIYSTNIGTEYFKHGVYSPFFSSSKCNFFHKSNVFGSCIIHILYTGCANI